MWEVLCDVEQKLGDKIAHSQVFITAWFVSPQSSTRMNHSSHQPPNLLINHSPPSLSLSLFSIITSYMFIASTASLIVFLLSTIHSGKKVQQMRMFDVKACWSQAGVGTSFVLEERTENNKGFNIVFDLGW